MTIRAGFAALAVLAVGLVLPTGAIAAGQPTISHTRINQDQTGVPVCGRIMDVQYRAVRNFIEFPDGSAHQSGSFSTRYTDPATGKYAVLSGALTEMGGEPPVIDEAAGTATYTAWIKGLFDKMRGSNGTGVVIRDAGLIRITTVYDLATHILIRQDAVFSGPHPGYLPSYDIDGRMALFCEELNAALA